MRAIAIGNFDGVHRGHVALLARAAHFAAQDDLETTAVTFEPHPADVLAARVPGRAPTPRLTGAERKRHLLSQLTRSVWSEPFTEALSRETPEQFVERLLVAQLVAKHVVVGENFRFGHKRMGDVDTLRELGARFGFEVHPLGLQHDETGVLSSTRVRELVASGDVEGASRVLGRYHAIFGEVVHGNALGRTLGVPTANIMTSEEMFPGRGIYAVWVGKGAPALERWALGVASVGTRPTVDPSATRDLVEVHLLDVNEDLYGQTLGIAFVAKLRDELRFDSLETLTQQMQLDLREGRAVLERADAALLQ